MYNKTSGQSLLADVVQTRLEQKGEIGLNLFHVHQDPAECARSYFDIHVGKILLEACQMMSTAVRHWHGRNPEIARPDYVNSLYLSTHQNHPMNVWVRASYENWFWTLEHAIALHEENQSRFSKTHGAFGGCLAYLMHESINQLMVNSLPYAKTPIPRCMPERYRVSSDAILCYRYYYRYGKDVRFHRWTFRPEPTWFADIGELPEMPIEIQADGDVFTDPGDFRLIDDISKLAEKDD